MTLEDIKLQIASKWEPDQLLDFLDISVEELVDILEEQIEERAAEFRQALA